ncbi:MAG: hypothetical protein GXO25_07595 [Euryarchaeota archaeon]|nr:hypothetical protein [Euryarchaeota archaeon]
MRSLSELWKISGIFYQNMAFQAFIDARRSGRSAATMEALTNRIKTNTVLNKIFLSMLFIIMAMYTAMQPSVLTYAAYLLLLTFLFALFFLQMVTYFFQIDFTSLRIYPVSREEEQKIALLTFIRIFDIPLAANLLVFPVVVLFSAPWYSAFLAIIAVLVSEILAIVLVTYLGKVFYTKLSTPASGLKGAVRFLYQLIWGLAFFMIYAFMMWLRVIYAKINHFAPLLQRYSLLFQCIYPTNMAYLIINPTPVSVASSLLMVLLTILGIKWILKNISSIKITGEMHTGQISIKISTPMRGMLRKDFRIITRSPALTMLLLFPPIQGLLMQSLGNSSYFALVMLFTFIIIFSYSLLGSEARSITRTLPVTRGFIYLSKAILGFIDYIIALTVLTLYTIFFGTGISQSLILLSLPTTFAVIIIVLRVGDLLNITKNIAMSSYGVALLMILGDVLFAVPLALYSQQYGVFVCAAAMAAEIIIALHIIKMQ